MWRDLAQRWAGLKRPAVRLGYLGVVAVFAVVVARLYQPDTGLAHLIAFGAKLDLPPVSELRNLDAFYQSVGYGYDGQYYVQIAMHPTLRSEELSGAIDNLPYRARRILTGWTAYALGLGRPEWILQAFAFQNVLAWLALAWVTLRWFPPVNWSNLLRWGGVLFGVGMCDSVRLALVDAPSVLLIAIGVWCVETNRRGLATGMLALSGLARETNLLAGVALIRPEERTWRRFGELCLRAVLIAAPLAAWLVYIHVTVGPSLDAGARNFGVPLAAFVERCAQIARDFFNSNGRDAAATGGMLVMISLATQFCFLAFRPRLRDVWWRVGAVFGVLMAVLGPAVWEGYPGAAARVLLPMHLAFNVLVPRGRRWLAVLVLGNLSLIVVPDLLKAIPGRGYRLEAEAGLSMVVGDKRANVEFDDHWYDAEHRSDRYWRWADGDASFAVVNPYERPVIATVDFYVDGIDQRRATVSFAGREVWTGMIARKHDARVVLEAVELQPGRNEIRITTDRPPKDVGIEAPHPIGFSLRNLQVRLLRLAP